MSFTRLEVGVERTMSDVELSPHEIDQYGNSLLPEYSDSIFSIIKLGNSISFSEGIKKVIDKGTLVTRILKKDLELPLDQPVVLSSVELAALRIRWSGYSDRPDLSAYKFKIQYMGYEKHEITKHNKY